jgi:hypothetical protein
LAFVEEEHDFGLGQLVLKRNGEFAELEFPVVDHGPQYIWSNVLLLHIFRLASFTYEEVGVTTLEAFIADQLPEFHH